MNKLDSMSCPNCWTSVVLNKQGKHVFLLHGTRFLNGDQMFIEHTQWCPVDVVCTWFNYLSKGNPIYTCLSKLILSYQWRLGFIKCSIYI